MIGWTIQVSLNLLRRRKQGSSASSASGKTNSTAAFWQQILLDVDSFKFGLFLSNQVLLFRYSNGLLNHFTVHHSSLNHMISGFMSGLSMFFYPSVEISLYTFWKTAFTMYAMRFGDSKYAQTVLDLIFFTADSFIINCMVMEPEYVPKSYSRFTDSVTASYLTKFNIVSHYLLKERELSSRYGTRFPDLQVDHCSKKYIETIGSWSLEQD